MNSAARPDGDPSELGELLALIVHRNEQALHRDVSTVLNAWGAQNAGAHPLLWTLKPRDLWEPQRGQHLIGQVEAGDDAAAVLDTWAKLLHLEPRGDHSGPGTLTFASPKGSLPPVQVWGVVDRDKWEPAQR
ncbi:hypothetical protein ACIQUM_36515 [Amycolatopsis azurea]|uniref:hypothetical protein n=1 Tax=Amycolatopsis azurea TaxID=36819 RepID=UPI0037FCD4D9